MTSDIFSAYFNSLSSQNIEPDKGEERCPHCGSDNLITTEGNLPHSSQIWCGDCYAHLRWMPLSKNLEKHLRYRRRIDQLFSRPLRSWDGIFIRDLDKRWRIADRDGKTLKLSPKQEAILSRIEGGDR